MKKMILLASCSLLLIACDRNSEENTSGGLTGSCLDALKAYDKLSNYMYKDPKSSLYKKQSRNTNEQGRVNMINTLKSNSQEGCKTMTHALATSLKRIKTEASRH